MNNDFKIFERLDKTRFLKIDSLKLNDCINYYNENINDFYGVMLSDTAGFKSTNIDFLSKLTSVRGLIATGKIENLSSLTSINEMEYLQLEEIDNELDLSLFKSLKVFRGRWSKKLINLIDAQKISELALWGYKPKNKDLFEVSLLPNLKKLELTSASLDSLNGIENTMSIESLSLHNMRGFADISALGKVKSTLKQLHFENCKGITSYDVLAGCQYLESLNIEKCGTIEDISFIQNLERLKQLFFVGTKLLNIETSLYKESHSLQKVVGTKGEVLFRR